MARSRGRCLVSRGDALPDRSLPPLRVGRSRLEGTVAHSRDDPPAPSTADGSGVHRALDPRRSVPAHTACRRTCELSVRSPTWRTLLTPHLTRRTRLSARLLTSDAPAPELDPPKRAPPGGFCAASAPTPPHHRSGATRSRLKLPACRRDPGVSSHPARWPVWRALRPPALPVGRTSTDPRACFAPPRKRHAASGFAVVRCCRRRAPMPGCLSWAPRPVCQPRPARQALHRRGGGPLHRSARSPAEARSLTPPIHGGPLSSSIRCPGRSRGNLALASRGCSVLALHCATPLHRSFMAQPAVERAPPLESTRSERPRPIIARFTAPERSRSAAPPSSAQPKLHSPGLPGLGGSSLPSAPKRSGPGLPTGLPALGRRSRSCSSPGWGRTASNPQH